jgi:hypothetical protein
MATFDQLSAEQRAIVELVLRQGKTYGELSEMLNLPEGRVRELARDALVELAPVSVRGVEEDWRGQLADYVLGQQSGPEASATKGHLRRSEAARSWARSLLDSLDQFYENGSLPSIPEGERGRRAAAAAAGPREPRPSRSATGGRLAPTADRRWLMAGAAALILILLAVLVWPIGAVTGGGDDNKSTASSGGSNSGTQTTGGGSSINARAQGQVAIVSQAGQRGIIITASNLTPSGQSTGYQVWLYNSKSDRKLLGAQVTDQQGNFQASAKLPSDYRKYKFVDVTTASVSGQNTKTGDSVMRGILKYRDKPVTRGTGKQKVTLYGQANLLPLPGSG